MIGIKELFSTDSGTTAGVLEFSPGRDLRSVNRRGAGSTISKRGAGSATAGDGRGAGLFSLAVSSRLGVKGAGSFGKKTGERGQARHLRYRPKYLAPHPVDAGDERAGWPVHSR